jgi:hypothetical protein
MFKTFLFTAAAGILATLTLTSPASADQTFNSPTQGGQRLDWCADWGVGCGQQAADIWCRQQGYSGAGAFAIANNIGASTPTRLVNTGAVCDQGFCDGFSYITCESPQPVRFNSPTQGSQRLDWCADWGVGCGQQAANAYCRQQGYAVAVNFAIANNIGTVTPTRLINTGAVCDQGFCDGFTYIDCQA